MRILSSLPLLLIAVTGAAHGAAQGPVSPSLDVKVMAQVERDGGERVEMVVDDGGVLRSGDGLQLRLRSRGDVYVYVIAYGASGRIQLLRPFSGESEKALLPGDKLEVFPAEGVFLPLDGVTGREALFVLASRGPMKDLGSLLRRAQESASVEGAYAVLRAAHSETLRIDIRHIDRAPLIGLEFAGSAKVSAAPALDPDSRTSRAGRGGVVSIPSTLGYRADPSLERGGWLGSYEEEGVLSSVGSRIPGVDPPPAVVLPAAAVEASPRDKEDQQGKSLRERLGQWLGRKPGDDGSAPGEQRLEGDPAADEADEASSQPARGGDN